MEKRLLITGFEPFGNSTVNSSWLAVEKLPDKIGPFILRKRMLPTVYGKAAMQVLAEADAFHPEVILCVGVAAGRSAVTPERIGVNIRSSATADNAGNRMQGEPVVPGAPAGYFATVPIEKMVQAISERQIPATISNSAGTFVCNDVLFTVLHHFDGSGVLVGFIHVPALPEQTEKGMPLEQITAALEAAVLACQ